MNDWAQLSRALDAIAASGSAELREDGEWLADLAGLHCDLRPEGNSPLVHLWSGECNLTRRILRVKEQTDARIILEVQRFGRTKPAKLEFLRTDSSRSAGRITREQFRARLRRVLAEQFPDATVESLTASPDLEHSFSGLYVRGKMHEGSRSWAIIAVAPGENAATIEGILAFGVLWLDWTRGHADRRPVEGLRLLVPEGTGRRLRERVLGLSSSVRPEIFEFTEPEGRIQKMDVADAGNLESWLVPRGEVESTIAQARGAFAQIASVAALASQTAEITGPTGGRSFSSDIKSSLSSGVLTPEDTPTAFSANFSAASEALATRAITATSEIALCFRGLEFARWTKDGILFGLGDAREKLAKSNAPKLDRLVHQLDLHRSPLAAETNHRLYRASPERWLESLVLEDPSRLEAQLDSRFLYSQVPALAAGDRGVIDLLGVTRRGRLVVIELKASEDIQLTMQAVDDWLRVRRHQCEGDFHEFGYFAGVELDPQPPLVWLVAPGLRFHPATSLLLKYLSPEISVTRVGLVENWRRGIKVIFRQ